MPKETAPQSLYGSGREFLREQDKTNELLAGIFGAEYTDPGEPPRGNYFIEKRLLDAAQEKNKILESAEGSFESVIKDGVDEWLDDHPEATTTVEDGSLTVEKFADGVVDDTLSVSGAVAEAKAVGDEIADLKTQIDDVKSASNDANYILNSCVKYWGDFENLDIVPSSAAKKVSVHRLGQISVFGGTTEVQTYIKLSGACNRASNTSGRNGFAKEIALKQGHRYSLSAKIVSGSYSPNTNDLWLVMYDNNNNRITEIYFNETGNKWFVPQADLTANIVLAIPTGTTITNLTIFITLQDVTTASDANGIYNNIYTKIGKTINPDEFDGTDNEKISAAMSAIGDENHGVILINRQYKLTTNVLVSHRGSADARIIFLGIGDDNPGFDMGQYGFVGYDTSRSYGALSFVNILFKATNIVFNVNYMVRLHFENCVFDGFNHVIYTTRFAQTMYFTDCLFRNGTGIAIEGHPDYNAPLIDVRLTLCVVEKSTHFLTGYGLHGVSITNCCIEGNDGYVVNAKGDCRDLVVDNCYFESQNIGYAGGEDGNGVCFDFRNISGIVHNVAITNNMFSGLHPGNTIILLPYRMMEHTKFTVTGNWLSPATSSDPEVESGAYLVAVPDNAVNVYKNLYYAQNSRGYKYDPNHLIVDQSEGNTSVASLLVTEYYMTHDDEGNPTTRYNPGFWYICEDLDDLYAPGYYHISADIPIAHSPANISDDFYLINIRTNDTTVQIAITSSGLKTRIGNGSWI